MTTAKEPKELIIPTDFTLWNDEFRGGDDPEHQPFKGMVEHIQKEHIARSCFWCRTMKGGAAYELFRKKHPDLYNLLSGSTIAKRKEILKRWPLLLQQISAEWKVMKEQRKAKMERISRYIIDKNPYHSFFFYLQWNPHDCRMAPAFLQIIRNLVCLKMAFAWIAEEDVVILQRMILNFVHYMANDLLPLNMTKELATFLFMR